jgi:hypothetical protein
MSGSRDATFFKNIFSMKDSDAPSSQATYISIPEPPSNPEPTPDIEQVTDQDIDAPRRSKRQRIEKSLVMILSPILWMIYPRHFQRHMHH